MIKGLLFDMDGVLVNTEVVHQEARRQVFEKYGVPKNALEGLRVMGRNTESIFRDVEKKHPFPLPLDQVIREKRDLFVKLLNGPLDPLPGVLDFLTGLKGAFKTGLVTSSAKINVEAVMEKTNLNVFFDTLVCDEDVTRFKPDPEGYLLAADRLKISPTSAVVFEDSEVGVAAGKAAGAFVVGVKNPFTPQTLDEADMVVKNFVLGKPDLLKLLESQKS